jgi:endonuclease YncB( thermonuclease family)
VRVPLEVPRKSPLNRRGPGAEFDKYQRKVCVLRVQGVEQAPENRAAYAAAEAEARIEKRGLWRDARPVPPWEWRAAKATKKEITAQ